MGNNFQGFPKGISPREINKHFYFTVQSNGSKIIDTGESWDKTYI